MYVLGVKMLYRVLCLNVLHRLCAQNFYIEFNFMVLRLVAGLQN